MIVGIDHVQVVAPERCEVEARAFYGALLGLEEIAKPPLLAARGGCWFRAGAQELHVGVTAGFVPAQKAHAALRVESEAALEMLAARLERAGVELQWADAGEIPGARRFHVSDPFGNRLELIA